MLAEGTYHGNAIPGKSAIVATKTGGDMMLVAVQITHVEKDGAWHAITPVTRSLYLSLSEKAWPYTQKKLAALGWDGDGEKPSFSPAAVCDGFAVIVRHKDYEGKMREHLDLANWGDGPELKRVALDRIRRIEAMWKSPNPAPPAASPPAPKPAGAPQPSPRTAPAKPASPAVEMPNSAFITTQEEAYDALAAVIADPTQLAQIWEGAQAKVATDVNRAESEFTGDDWGTVVDLAGQMLS